MTAILENRPSQKDRGQKRNRMRPIFRSQLSCPSDQLMSFIPRNIQYHVVLSGQESFSVSYTQKLSYRDQQQSSPGTVFLGCPAQTPSMFDFSSAIMPQSAPSSSFSSFNLANRDSVPCNRSIQYAYMKTQNPSDTSGSSKSYRRSSLAVQSSNAPEQLDPLVGPYAPNSAYYHPQSAPQVGTSTKYSGAGTSNQQQHTAPALLHSPSIHYFLSSASATPTVSPAAKNNRRKAVITVDAKTTEILIASDSICGLFGLRDRSLIGKKLAEVFPMESAPIRKCSTDSKSKVILEDVSSKKGPSILEKNILFDGNHRLRPVYGKPVDILDAVGNKSTVCVWSYPLTTTAALISQRKSSSVLRSPTSYLYPHSARDYANNPTSETTIEDL
ncbi:PAS domain-containing serine/threonine-protein kinase [Ditylenchus destructor]|nr:PAS domain-containing serine/threonine-protein kinase [Ditylenchus destructor]